MRDDSVKFWFCIVLSLSVFYLGGCSSAINISRRQFVLSMKGAVADDNQPRWAYLLQEGIWDNLGKVSTSEPSAVKIKYHNSYAANRWMVVSGTIKEHRYPVILDTGASQSVFITQKHIRENNLTKYTIPDAKSRGLQGWGLCNLNRLVIGPMVLSDWPSFYRKSDYLLGLFDTTPFESDFIILGLPLLKEFSYIVFDSINQEVEFAFDGPFIPQQQGDWHRYDIFVETDITGNNFLFVEITVASVPLRIQLDTGSGRGLALSRTLWPRISAGLSKIEFSDAYEYYPYIGNLTCKRTMIEKLEFGGRVLNNVHISVFDDNSPLLEDCDALVGMEYFSGTIFVLDFENGYLWVKDV